MNRADRHRKRVGVMAAAFGLVLLTACTPIVHNHGYVPPEDMLAEVAVGKDTRDSVAEKVGLPLNKSLTGDAAWYYVATTRETFGPREPKVTSREIVAILFSDAGTVQQIDRYTAEDGREVTLTARVTDASVPDQNLLGQIFGNLGGPSASDFLE